MSVLKDIRGVRAAFFISLKTDKKDEPSFKKKKDDIYKENQNPLPAQYLSQACNFIKKEALVQVFSCEFCEISENTFFHRTPEAASVFYRD